MEIQTSQLKLSPLHNLDISLKHILIIFAAISLIAVLFSVVPYIPEVTDYVHPFIMNRLQEFFLRSYVWELGDHIKHVVLYYVIYKLGTHISADWKPYLIWFLAFEFALLIEYILTRNEPFFYVDLGFIGSTIGLSHVFIIMKLTIVSIYFYSCYGKRD